MKFFNEQALKSISSDNFLTAKPFPWAVIPDILQPVQYEELVSNMPAFELFEKDFGKSRKYGQRPHNRYRLNLASAKAPRLPRPWQEFIEEIYSAEYRAFIENVFGVKHFLIRLEWHYTPVGAEVTPHLDGGWTIGAHLLYFNRASDWKKEWGGQTLILASDKSLSPESSPEFRDFTVVAKAGPGNESIIFKNQDNAWHGVETLAQPDGVYRALFTIFIARPKPLVTRVRNRILQWITGKEHR